MGRGSPAPLTTSGFRAPSFFAHIVGGWGRQGPSSHPRPSLLSTFSVSGRSFWGRAFYSLSSVRKGEREGSRKKKEGRETGSSVNYTEGLLLVGALATQVSAPDSKPGESSEAEMSEPEQLPSVAGGKGLVGRPLTSAKGSVLGFLPSSAAQGWAGLISWQWLLQSCSLVEST